MIKDRSGSMGGLESDTIVGYDGMLRKVRDTDDDIQISTSQFDGRTGTLHDRVLYWIRWQKSRKRIIISATERS